MRIQLVFQGWLSKDRNGRYDLSNIVYAPLALKDTTPGSAFDATIDLPMDDTDNLRAALAVGCAPVFYAAPIDPDAWRRGRKEDDKDDRAKIEAT